MSIFPDIDAAAVITLVGGQMNLISSLIHRIKQVNILHSAKQEQPEVFFHQTKNGDKVKRYSNSWSR
jgi:hypothetical protein